MTVLGRREPVPAECLDELPSLELDVSADGGDELSRVELRRAVLSIAEVDHIAEVDLVSAVVDAMADESDGEE
ncbi:MAG: hypothetical protein ABWY11_10410 [Umezawaea sp.]